MLLIKYKDEDKNEHVWFVFVQALYLWIAFSYIYVEL